MAKTLAKTLARTFASTLATACLLLSPVAPALSLRLDTELTTKPGTKGADVATVQLIRFGTSDLQRRVFESRQRTATVRAENRILRGHISGTEELIAHMRDFSGVQERTMGLLKVGIEWQQTARAPVLNAASAPAPLASPAPPVVTRVQAAPATPKVTQAKIPAAVRPEPARLSVAGIELPNWLLGGVVGALLTAMSVWLFGLVARRRQAVATEAVADVDTPHTSPGVEQTDAEVLRELWNEQEENEGATEHGGRPSNPSADLAGSMTQHSQSVTDAGPTSLVDDALAEQAADKTDWSRTMVSRKAADPQALKEVDTLIAFEQFDKAKVLLDQMLAREPKNPEYMLRHYHVRTQGGVDTSADDAEVLRAMMDGPMSDTLLRVREIGRGLMPGDPLFDDNAQREEAVQVLTRSRLTPEPVAESEPDFAQTVVLNPGDAALRNVKKRAKD